VVLLVLAAAVLGRPWEHVRLGDPPSPSATAYIGVDTPETVKPDTPVQCFGPKAHRFNARIVTHQRVRLIFGEERRDVYGRLLAYVYLGRRFVNAELARRGFARTLTIPPNDRFARRFKRLQTGAARAGKGLWGAC
jgi:micrococcal nuclease